MLYTVRFTGPFGFIKPWTAVRDGVTFSQQFLTPSIVEGLEKKLFPELLQEKGIKRIVRYKLQYDAMTIQQEVTQSRGYNKNERPRSILKRGLLLNPILTLAFDDKEDAEKASCQHICLCRNEDLLYPDTEIREFNIDEFDILPGFELKFGISDQSFLVGYNRFDYGKPMYGWLEFNGLSLL